MSGRDTKTRYQGVFARHQKDCATNSGRRCRCKPSYYGVVWDRARKRHVKTKRMPTIEAARNARSDLSGRVERGELPDGGGIRLSDARARFVAAAREGRALNKHGRRYKPRAIDDIDEVLRVHVEPTLGAKRISTIRRSHVQALVDELAPELSGSRVRSVVNGLRSLYRWAQDRELTSHDPAALVRLPAMDATPIERVASPAEFAQLLAALDPKDALPYALAGYGMGRRAQIVRLRWTEVDLKVGALEWGVEWEARKYEASRRRGADRPAAARAAQARVPGAGAPEGGPRLPAPRRLGNNGPAEHGLARQARCEDLERSASSSRSPCRRRATLRQRGSMPPESHLRSPRCSWDTRHLNASPAPRRSLWRRYTHALPEDIERARAKLAAYLAEAQKAEAAGQ